VATRFYIEYSDTPSVSPAYDSNWDATYSSFIRRKLYIGPAAGSMEGNTRTAGEDSGSPVYVGILQAVSEPLDAHSSATEDIDWALGGFESNSKLNGYLHVVIRKCDTDGSNPTTIGSFTDFTDDTEFPTTGILSRYHLKSYTMSLSQGQRLVIEMGYYANNTKTTLYNGSVGWRDKSGDPDCPESDGNNISAIYNTWIEIAGTYTEASTGDVTVPVGLPSGVGAPLATSQLFDYVFSVGIPSGVGAPLTVVPSGEALIVVGIPSGLGEPLSVVSSGAAIAVVGIPSGVGAPLSTSQLFDYVFSVGIPSGVGAPLTVVPSGEALIVVGIPSGLGEPLSVVHIGGAIVVTGIPGGVGAPLATTQLFDYVFSVGLPSGVGEPLSVTVLAGASELVVVGLPSGVGAPLAVVPSGAALIAAGIPSGVGAPLSVTAVGAALVAAGIPSGLAEALSVALSLGANVTVGIPSGLGEALPTEQLYDYVLSVGIPGGVGTPLAVTVSLDGAKEESFIIIPARRRRRM
jgi:hypothetical protein